MRMKLHTRICSSFFPEIQASHEEAQKQGDMFADMTSNYVCATMAHSELSFIVRYSARQDLEFAALEFCRSKDGVSIPKLCDGIGSTCCQR